MPSFILALTNPEISSLHFFDRRGFKLRFSGSLQSKEGEVIGQQPTSPSSFFFAVAGNLELFTYGSPELSH